MALENGLILLPGGLLMGIAALFIGTLFDKFGPRPLVIPGTFVLSGALFLLTFVGRGTPVSFVVLAHLTMSLGLASMMTPQMTNTLSSLPVRLYTRGSATTNTLQQFAGAVSTALFIAVMTGAAITAREVGFSPISAHRVGILPAFVVAAVGSIMAVCLSFLVRRAAVPVVESAAATGETP
ncbi:MFS transporter [Leucobacter tardus]|uniref:Major facilitator superfamily (MFS) profile domain-containing protein n=1 Tax=Leucobacter tardus TaxID=501483 RepID=A0A939TTN0_9MICO|nr:MFS transporter [Leucobacter tardus]MBO2988875.1 hypothetical protein [Leucobacter tardus]